MSQAQVLGGYQVTALNSVNEIDLLKFMNSWKLEHGINEIE